VDLRHFAALSAVAHERSFSGAADRLGYVQSAVSQQVSYLERLVGMRLVERARGPQRVSLTPAGALLLGHVDHVLAQLRVAHADFEERLIGVHLIGHDSGRGMRSVELNLRAHCVEPSRVVALFWHRHRNHTPALDAVRSAARTAAAELLSSPRQIRGSVRCPVRQSRCRVLLEDDRE
jgi:molybdenum-dependent DNA-binding transcriptional regulator ModE